MALNKIFQNPKLNNIQFVEQGAVLNPKYNNLPIDKEWYYENILSYQFQQKYFQPVRQGDLIWLEFHRTDTNGVGIDIVSCSGDILETVYATNQVAVEGHTYEGEQLHTSSIRFLFSDYDLPNGYYYLRPFADFYDGETLIERLLYISEPLDVREEHPDTVLLECYNFSNKLYIS